MVTVTRAVTALVTTAALVLVGCGSDDVPSETKQPGPLGGLSGDDICTALDREAIERDFDVQVERADPTSNHDVAIGKSGWVNCRFGSPRPLESASASFSFSVDVHNYGRGQSAKESLESGFVNEYQTVEGLGDLAAYGNDFGSDKLAAIIEGQQGLVTIQFKVSDASLEQLRPYMERVLQFVESRVR